jgi:PAS domain S-box-containing protein
MNILGLPAFLNSKEALFTLIDQLPLSLLLCRMNGQFVYANQHLADALGYNIDELQKLSYWELTPEKYRSKELFQLAQLKHTGRYGPYEKEYIDKYGKLIPVSLTGVLIEMNGEEFIWSIITKISETLEITGNKSKSETQAIHTEKMAALGQLVAGIAHEINNPVNFIYGNLVHVEQYNQCLAKALELYQTNCSISTELQDSLDEMELDFVIEDLPKVLQSIRLGSERIRRIVKSLRSFSRLDEAEFKTVDIHEGLDDSLLILEYRIKKTGIAIIRNYGVIPSIECFPGELNQVFLNLLSNAIDALEEISNPCIQIQTERYGKHIAVRISDNGKGIPNEIQEQIFNPFFTTKAVGKGTGLGLAISHQIITEKHKGFLSFKSALGKGTDFLIQLPITLNVEEPPCCSLI